MCNKMCTFFNQVYNGAVVPGIYFFTAITAIFSCKCLSTVFTCYGRILWYIHEL